MVPVYSCVAVSHLTLLATPWTVTYQAPLSMGFSRREYWSRLPFPPPGDLLIQGSNPGLSHLLHCRQILSHWATRECYLQSSGGCKFKPQWDADSQSLFPSRSIDQLDWGCLRMWRTRIHCRLLRNATWCSHFEKQIGNVLKSSIPASSKSTQDNEKYTFTQRYVHEWSQKYYS